MQSARSPCILKDIRPAAVVNIISGGSELRDQPASPPQMRKISFTGSVATGKKTMSYAADLRRGEALVQEIESGTGSAADAGSFAVAASHTTS